MSDKPIYIINMSSSDPFDMMVSIVLIIVFITWLTILSVEFATVFYEKYKRDDLKSECTNLTEQKMKKP